MSIEFVKDEIEDIINDYIRDSEAIEVSAGAIGLDPRAGNVLVSFQERWIAVGIHSNRSIEYYGGFEYVDHENKTVLGSYIFYDDGSDRVNDCIDYYSENHIDQ